MQSLTDDQIWAKASEGDPSALSDPRVSTLRNGCGSTPPHLLAWAEVKEVWSHHDFNKAKNKNGGTPKDWWFQAGYRLPTCTDFIND